MRLLVIQQRLRIDVLDFRVFVRQVDAVVARGVVLLNVKWRCVVGVAGTGMSRLEDEAGIAGVLDDVTPAGIGDIVRGAQHSG